MSESIESARIHGLHRHPETWLSDAMDKAFPEKSDEVHLQLVKCKGCEVICDQDGRVLAGVRGFRYEQLDLDSVPILIVKMIVKPSRWDKGTGVSRQGEDANLDAEAFG